jgi:SAM-dependent methyltransferase
MKLNLGCGGNKLDGWENHDSDVDIRGTLPWGNNSVDFILLEHCLEHVSGPDGFCFMREAYRILKPGGVLRVCVPILDPKMTKEHRADLILGHGHLMVYSPDSLCAMLLTAGFSRVDATPRRDCDGHWRAIGKEKDDLETQRMEAMK